MSSRTVRVVTFCLVMLAAFVSGALSNRTQILPGATAAEANETKIKTLRQERLTVLQDIAEMTFQLYQHARVSFSEVIEARREARIAELELCETDVERVAIWERMLTETKELEQLTLVRKEAGRDTEASLLRAKADRLEVEIALEQAKSK